MMKSIFLVFGIVLLVGNMHPVLATEDAHDEHTHHDEERVEHYEAKKPNTVSQALSLLEDKSNFIAQALETSPLDSKALEAIHEASYGLEAAVDRLREDQKDEQKTALDSLDEAVQALHHASEEHEEDATREWFNMLQIAKEEVKQIF